MIRVYRRIQKYIIQEHLNLLPTSVIVYRHRPPSTLTRRCIDLSSVLVNECSIEHVRDEVLLDDWILGQAAVEFELFRGLTFFDWHRQLKLRFVFIQAFIHSLLNTPRYLLPKRLLYSPLKKVLILITQHLKCPRKIRLSIQLQTVVIQINVRTPEHKLNRALVVEGHQVHLDVHFVADYEPGALVVYEVGLGVHGEVDCEV